MFNEYIRTIYQTYVLGFLLRQGQDFLLEIHNHFRHIFSQYTKEGKTCQNGSSFLILVTDPIQARLFSFKCSGVGL